MTRFKDFTFLPRSECIGIGSTDARRLAAGEWDTLFDEKTGAKQPEDLTFHWKPRLGLETEALHAWWHGLKACSYLDGEPLLEPPLGPDGKSHAIVKQAYQKDCPAFTSIDRWVVEDDCPLEMKHTHGQNNLRQAAEYYMPQLQWQLMVTGCERVRFSIICGNEEPQWGYVAEDLDYQRRLLKMGVEFWGLVQTGERPPAIEPAAELKQMAKAIPINGLRAYDHTTLPSANEFIAKAVDYIALKPKADEFKEVDKAIRAMLPKDASEVTAGGLTFKRDARGAMRCTINA